MALNVGTLTAHLTANTGGYVRGMLAAQQATRETEKVVKAAGGGLQALSSAMTAIGAASGAMAVALKGASIAAVDMAAHANEARKSMDVAFGRESAKNVEAWANTFSSAVGRSRYEMMEAATGLQMMLKPMVGNTRQAEALSKSLTELSVDVGAYRDVSTQDALFAVKGALAGNTSSINERFGAAMTEKNLQAFAQSQGITQSIEKMDQHNLVLLRAAYLQRFFADAMGAAAREGDGYTQQLERLRGTAKDLATDFGKQLEPEATKFLQTINATLAPLRSMPPEMMKTAAAAASAATAIAGTTAAVAGLALAYAKVRVFLDGETGAAFTSSLKGIASGLRGAIGPALAFAAAIAGVILIAGSLKMLWDTYSGEITAATRRLGAEFAKVWEAVAQATQDAWEHMAAVVRGWAEGAIRVYEGVKNAVLDMIAAQLRAAGKLVGKLQDWGLLSKDSSLAQGLTIAESGINKLKGALDAKNIAGAFKDVGAFASDAIATAKGYIEAGVETVKDLDLSGLDGFSKAWANGTKLFGGVLDGVLTRFKQESGASGAAEGAQGGGKTAAAISPGGGMSAIELYAARQARLAALAQGTGSAAAASAGVVNAGTISAGVQDYNTLGANGGSNALSDALRAFGDRLRMSVGDLPWEKFIEKSAVAVERFVAGLSEVLDSRRAAVVIDKSLGSVREAFIGMQGIAGDMFRSIKAGLADGDAIGAAVAALTTLVLGSRQFSELLTALNGAFQGIADAIGMLIAPLTPILSVVGNIAAALLGAIMPLVVAFNPVLVAFNTLAPFLYMLSVVVQAVAPLITGVGMVVATLVNPMLLLSAAIKPLFEAVRWLAIKVVEVAILFAEAWNGAMGAIKGIIGKVIDAFSKYLPGEVTNYLRGVNNALFSGMTIGVENMEQQLTTLKEMTFESAAAAAKGMTAVAAAAQKTAEALTNVPTGFKIASARFAATMSIGEQFSAMGITSGGTSLKDIPRFATGGYAPAGTGLAILGDGGEGEYVVPESKMGALGGITINVIGAGDPDTVAERVIRRLERLGLATNGTTFPAGPRFAVGR